MEIILKRKFKYKVSENIKSSPRFTADIRMKEGWDLRYTWIHRVKGDTYEEAVMNARKWINGYSHVIWLEDYIHDRWTSFKYFIRSLNPVRWDSKPLTLWKEYSKYFKKLPVKFSAFRHEKIENLYPTERNLKWYNPVFVYVSDVYWKTKYRDRIFMEPPQIRIILFRRWSLQWSWTATMLDSLYWETMLTFADGDLKKEELNKYYLTIHPTGEEIHLEPYLNLKECGITNTLKIYQE